MAWLPWKRSRESGTDHPLSLFRREMHRLMDDVFGGSRLVPWSSDWLGGPSLDVRETEAEVVVDLEAPGLKPDEIDVSLSNSTLTIRGERKEENDQDRGDYHVRERSYGSFCRSVRLPTEVESDKVTSQYRDGVLTVTLPKSEQAKPKKIEVAT
jgi:HSP20 family protein